MLYRRTVSVIFLHFLHFWMGADRFCATGSFCVKCNILRRNVQPDKSGCFDFHNVKRCQILASYTATLLSLHVYHSSFGLPQFSCSLRG